VLRFSCSPSGNGAHLSLQKAHWRFSQNVPENYITIKIFSSIPDKEIPMIHPKSYRVAACLRYKKRAAENNQQLTCFSPRQ